MNEHQRILEQIDACRPGSDDLAQAEMADLAARLQDDPGLQALYERVQRADAQIAEALYDVVVPEDLAERVKVALAKSELGTRNSEVEAPIAEVAPAANSKSVPRRRFMLAGAGLTAAAAVFFAVQLWPVPTAITFDQLLEDAIAYHLEASPDGANSLESVAPPKSLPPSRNVRLPVGTKWRHVANFMGHSGVAYDLATEDGKRATLYVVRMTVGDAPPWPSNMPNLTTGGCAVGAWQTDALAYVLVVQGDPRSYSRYIDPPRGSFT